jgi:hypothetical protein
MLEVPIRLLRSLEALIVKARAKKLSSSAVRTFYSGLIGSPQWGK